MRPARRVIQITIEPYGLEVAGLVRVSKRRDMTLLCVLAGWRVLVGRSIHGAAICHALAEKSSSRFRCAFRASGGRISRLARRKLLCDKSIAFFRVFHGYRQSAGRHKPRCGKQQGHSGLSRSQIDAHAQFLNLSPSNAQFLWREQQQVANLRKDACCRRGAPTAGWMRRHAIIGRIWIPAPSDRAQVVRQMPEGRAAKAAIVQQGLPRRRWP